MQNGVNEDGSGRLFVEADAVVADAKAEFAGVALQLLDVALASAGEAIESGENAHGSLAVEVGESGTCHMDRQPISVLK